MSHIFDALQRSEAERSGDQSASFDLATELLWAAEEKMHAPAAVAEPLAVPQFVPQFDQQLHRQFDPAPQPQQEPRTLENCRTLPVSIMPDSRLISVAKEESLAAEKFRFLAVRLRQMRQTRPLKKVLVTSSIPQEGKSTVSANLACTLARKKQQRTLLLEGDLRRPTVANTFGLANNLPGLSEWFHGETASPNLYYLESLGLWILPAGRAPQNPLELMQSGKISPLMEQLAAWFDWIVIDSPPLLPLADTSIWARLSDGILLVTRKGVTEKQQLQKGLEVVEQSKLLGAIVNGSTDTAHSDYYQRYGSPASSPESPKSRE